METVRELIERAERDGWNAGIAYRIARQCHGDDYSVCVLCGWAWPGANNRCVNPECRGFCSWGKRYEGEPSSWVRHPANRAPFPQGRWRPRMPGE